MQATLKHALAVDWKEDKKRQVRTLWCAINQLFLKFRKLPKIWLQQNLFTFTTPVVKRLHYNSFLIIIFDIQRGYFQEYFLSCFSTKAIAQRCFVKNMSSQILQNSQGKSCTRVSFLIKSLLKKKKKKEALAQVFSCQFCEIFKTPFL